MRVSRYTCSIFYSQMFANKQVFYFKPADFAKDNAYSFNKMSQKKLALVLGGL